MKKSGLIRAIIGGLIAVALLLFIGAFLAGADWFGGGWHFNGFMLADGWSARVLGISDAAAGLVQILLVFALGAMAGISTLPFAQTWPALLAPSIAHFVVTGLLALLFGWFNRWFGYAPARGPWIMLAVYLGIYVLIWAIRWVVWYTELRRLRRALEQRKEAHLP